MRRWIGRLPVLLLLAGAIGLLAFVPQEPETIKSLADRLAPDRLAERLPLAAMPSLQWRALGLGIAWLAAAGIWIAFGPDPGTVRSSLGDLSRRAAIRVRTLTRADRIDAALLVGLTVVYLGLALRLLETPMRCDEATTYLVHASKSPLGVLSIYTTNNHILHTLGVKVATQLFGGEPWAIRLPALMAGACLPAACYVAMRALFDRSTALIAAALLSVSAYAVDFGTNARGYTTITLCLLLLLALAPRIARPQAVGERVLFVVIASLGFFTVPVMAYPFAIVAFWLLFANAIRRDGQSRAGMLRVFGTLTATVIVVTLLYTPALLSTGIADVVVNPVLLKNQPESRPTLLADFARLSVTVWRDWSFGQPAVLVWALALGVVVSPVLLPRGTRGGVLLLPSVVLGTLAVLLISEALPPAWIHLFDLPIYFGLGVAGLLAIARRFAAPSPSKERTFVIAVAAAVVAINAVWSQLAIAQRRNAIEPVPWYVGYPDAPEAAAALAAILMPDDVVDGARVFEPPLRYYLQRAGVGTLRFAEGDAPLDADSVYFIDAANPLTEGIREKLVEDGFVVSETARELPRSRILRFARGATP
jgi:hypothetical protein